MDSNFVVESDVLVSPVAKNMLFSQRDWIVALLFWTTSSGLREKIGAKSAKFATPTFRVPV